MRAVWLSVLLIGCVEAPDADVPTEGSTAAAVAISDITCTRYPQQIVLEGSADVALVEDGAFTVDASASAVTLRDRGAEYFCGSWRTMNANLGCARNPEMAAMQHVAFRRTLEITSTMPAYDLEVQVAARAGDVADFVRVTCSR